MSRSNACGPGLRDVGINWRLKTGRSGGNGRQRRAFVVRQVAHSRVGPHLFFISYGMRELRARQNYEGEQSNNSAEPTAHSTQIKVDNSACRLISVCCRWSWLLKLLHVAIVYIGGFLPCEFIDSRMVPLTRETMYTAHVREKQDKSTENREQKSISATQQGTSSQKPRSEEIGGREGGYTRELDGFEIWNRIKWEKSRIERRIQKHSW